ncbi:hypothetical protein F4809DRAFT_595172 [Biscogniauxia mediterranea]|nr:hypothetical protein F4809DRAFT_595172 [Biscogniauxia mediterranea]
MLSLLPPRALLLAAGLIAVAAIMYKELGINLWYMCLLLFHTTVASVLCFGLHVRSRQGQVPSNRPSLLLGSLLDTLYFFMLSYHCIPPFSILPGNIVKRTSEHPFLSFQKKRIEKKTRSSL